MSSAHPPGLAPADRVVLFDGVCRLCSAWAQFLIRFDGQKRFKLATVQSPEGQALLSWFGMPTEQFDTMVLIEGNRVYRRSSAFVRVLLGLGLPFSLVAVVWVIPSPLRDWVYDRIALNRYRLFGKNDQCLLPTADHDSRFLGS